MAFSNEENVSTSLTHDSDEVKEMYCEHCDRHENKYEPAAGFCVDCVEYMCDTCLKYHRRYVHKHLIQSKDSMPQDFCFEKCSVHSNQIIKFYCEECRNFPCSECKTKNHQNCANVSHLPRLVNGIEKSKELNDLTENLNLMSKELEETEEQVNGNLQKVVTQEIEVMAATRKLIENLQVTYKKHQNDIIGTFDKKRDETIAKLIEERTELVERVAEKQMKFEVRLNDNENRVTKEFKKTKISDQKGLQSIKDTSVTIKTALKMISSDLTKQEHASQRCKLFMSMKKAEGETKKLKRELKKLRETNYIHSCNVKSEVNELDVLSFKNASTFFSYQEFPNSNKKRTANQHSDVKTKALEDSGLCLLQENTLLISDYKGHCLMSFRNLNVCKEPFSITSFSSGPWGIAKVKDNKVAVTFPAEDIVRVITFSEYMTVIDSDDITVGSDCFGIVYSYCNNSYIVSYHTIPQPGVIKMLDLSGNELKCFDKDYYGKDLFSWPQFLTVSPDSSTIYVSDWESHTITKMSLDGEVEAIYRDDELKGPRQLTVDEAGTVYVCGFWSNNVHQLSSDLSKVKILLDKSQGMCFPASVTCCQNNNRLYVGMYDSSSIKVFNLSTQ